MADKAQDRNTRSEAFGWLSLVVIMLTFPALYFICVWIPMWLGVAGPYSY